MPITKTQEKYMRMYLWSYIRDIYDSHRNGRTLDDLMEFMFEKTEAEQIAEMKADAEATTKVQLQNSIDKQPEKKTIWEATITEIDQL